MSEQNVDLRLKVRRFLATAVECLENENGPA